MNYQECITYLEQVCPRGSSGGKERTAIMAELMGNPQDSLRIIHVAGTNGKGSTSAVIESILRHGDIGWGCLLLHIWNDTKNGFKSIVSQFRKQSLHQL